MMDLLTTTAIRSQRDQSWGCGPVVGHHRTVDVTQQYRSTIAGRYLLEEKVGGGGMAVVWRARDLTLERQVAVKLVDLQPEDADTIVARFRREAIATAGLSHPNVVSVYDAGTDGDMAFLVMELLEGPSLAGRIRQDPRPGIVQTLPIVTEVASGLGAAHSIGITHRDIKPGNVVLHRGVAKIVDFGIARLTESAGENLTSPDMVVGTASYMSPEQACGLQVGTPSDVYSLGCTIMALLTGAAPFTDGGAVAVARAHVSDVPPRLSSRRPDVPGHLDELMTGMLDKAPSARPTIPQVVAELERIERDITGGSPMAAAPVRLVPPHPSAPSPNTGRSGRTGVVPPMGQPSQPRRAQPAPMPQSQPSAMPQSQASAMPQSQASAQRPPSSAASAVPPPRQLQPSAPQRPTQYGRGAMPPTGGTVAQPVSAPHPQTMYTSPVAQGASLTGPAPALQPRPLSGPVPPRQFVAPAPPVRPQPAPPPAKGGLQTSTWVVIGIVAVLVMVLFIVLAQGL